MKWNRDEAPERTVKSTIVVNGVAYENVEDVPEEYRALVEDMNGDGIPDVAQTAEAADDVKMSIEINGVEYTDPADVPEEFRYLVADENGDGIPDIVQNAGVPGELDGQRVIIEREYVIEDE